MNSNMKPIFLTLILLCLSSLICASKHFDYFYFVQQWPGSYCDTRRGCCYPKTGKPEEDFSIHGLWPENNDGSYPFNCDRTASFDKSKISDLTSKLEKNWPSLTCPSSDGFRFWSHEWEKHGTCSESILNQHAYFQTALNLKQKASLLQVLNNAEIRPGNFFSPNRIKDAIKKGLGYEPEIECNVDHSGNRQLYQVYLCVDKASNFIDCLGKNHGRPCGSEIEFPSFSKSPLQEI